MLTGLIGLALSGKTTVFNAITSGHAQVGSFATQKGSFNRGRVLIRDERLDWLAQLEGSRKTTYAEVEYLDVAGFSGERDTSSQQEIPQVLRETEALAHIVRAFDNPAVPHPKGSINVRRDIEALEEELIFSDLLSIEKRLERIDKQAKHTKDERVKHELEVLQRVKVPLEENKPLRGVSLDPEDVKVIRGFQFLSQKPLLVVVNVGEEEIPRLKELESEYAYLQQLPDVDCAVLCGEIEMELAQLPNGDRQAFMTDLGITESALDLLIRKSYSLLGLISFLTAADREARAWTVRKGTTAPEAAGVIHADMQRGFIRAEAVSYSDLRRWGSHTEAKKQGVVRLEGKNYIVQDGDVIYFRFNV